MFLTVASPDLISALNQRLARNICFRAIESNCPVSIRNRKQETPLFFRCFGNKKYFFEFLFQKQKTLQILFRKQRNKRFLVSLVRNRKHEPLVSSVFCQSLSTRGCDREKLNWFLCAKINFSEKRSFFQKIDEKSFRLNYEKFIGLEYAPTTAGLAWIKSFSLEKFLE